jgi:hypothetical protein
MTVIDASRLTEIQPKEVTSRLVPLPERIQRKKPHVVPLAKPQKEPVEIAREPHDQPTAETTRETNQPPSITRPSKSVASNPKGYQPHISRARMQAIGETGTSVQPQINRAKAVSESTPGVVTIARSRGVAGVDLPIPGQRVTVLRSSPATGEGTSDRGEAGGVVIRHAGRGGRSSDYSGVAQGSGGVLVASRGRGNAAGGVGDETGSSVGMTRGISLMSLDICSSPQEEEEHIRAVLGVVGSRHSCVDGKGEFQFKGTKRISSFNLMIYPAKGRRPSNRCEELEYAYNCLKNH